MHKIDFTFCHSSLTMANVQIILLIKLNATQNSKNNHRLHSEVALKLSYNSTQRYLQDFQWVTHDSTTVNILGRAFWAFKTLLWTSFVHTFFFILHRGYCKIYCSTSWAETAQGKCKIIKGATFPEGCKSRPRQSTTWVSRFFSHSTTCSIGNPGQSLTNTFMSADDIRHLGQTRPALYVSTVTSHNSQYTHTHSLEADLWRAKAKHGRGETIFPLHYTDFRFCHS